MAISQTGNRVQHSGSHAMDNKELERLAQEELLQEAKRAKSRAEEMGPMGWQRCPLPATNKRFLRNVLVSTLEPRKKKPKQAGTESCRTKEKVPNCKPVDKDDKGSNHKNTSKHQNKSDKDRHKHHKHKSKHKRNTP